MMSLFLFSSECFGEQICAKDLDGDGDYLQSNEIAVCKLLGDKTLCPIDTVECQVNYTCPLDGNLICNAGSCEQPVACKARYTLMRTWVYDCPTTGITYQNEDECTGSCKQTALCDSSEPICPTQDGGPCLDIGGGNYECSATACFEGNTIFEEITEIDDRIYKDDGERTGEGECLDQVMLFSGRTMSCRTPGLSTAYNNCCNESDTILQDSVGSATELGLGLHAIQATFAAAKTAFDAYRAGQTAADAGKLASDALIETFGPANIAATIAITMLVDYLANNCNQMDSETSVLNNSGYCYQTGIFCEKRIFGSGCVQKAESYCCFNSKLGRILHEQGRSQLEVFNDISSNDCRGFTPEQFQYLDFSRINFTDYYDDLRKNTESERKAMIEEKLNEFHQAI